uniref:Variant surface glycoprotein 1347 n=1 Tax=Trypanosoma brucei TaxID=5691 RepID=M4SW74_9TRYP|nr:variant surface glycoprotein 1347 [Trypanosoma brucei]
MATARYTLLAATLLIKITGQIVIARTSKHAALAATFSNLCTLTGELKSAHEFAASKLSQGVKEIKALNKIYRQVSAYALQQGPTADGRLAFAVSASAEKLISLKRQDYDTLVAKALTATAKAALAAGHATEFLEIMSQASTGTKTNGGCILDNDASGGGAGVWSGLQGATAGCKSTELKEVTELTTAAAARPDFAKVASAEDAGAATHSQTGCRLLGNPSTQGDTPGNVAVTGNNILYAAGAVLVDNTAAVKVQGMESLQTGSDQARWHEEEQALAGLDSPSFGMEGEADTTLYNHLLSDDDFLQAALQLLTNESKKGTAIKNTPADLNKIKDKIGTSAALFTKPYLHDIRESTIDDNTEWGIKLTGKKLSNLDSNEQYAKLLQYYNSRPQPDVAETTCQPETATPKDDAANQKICEKFHDKPKE